MAVSTKVLASPPRLKECHPRGDDVRAEDVWMSEKAVFGTWLSYFTHELATFVVICRRPVQGWTCQRFITQGRGPGGLTLHERQLAVSDSLAGQVFSSVIDSTCHPCLGKKLQLNSVGHTEKAWELVDKDSSRRGGRIKQENEVVK